MKPLWISLALVCLLAAPAVAQAPACDETELRQMRYLVRLFGETRTSAEFELAKWRARADMLATELDALKATLNRRAPSPELPAGKPEGE